MFTNVILSVTMTLNIFGSLFQGYSGTAQNLTFFFVCLFQFRVLVHSVTVKALIKKKTIGQFIPRDFAKTDVGVLIPLLS